MNRPHQVAVERGIVWLDEHFPDWFQKLNIQTLTMSDCRRCVLGQLTGFYSNVVFNGAAILPRYESIHLQFEDAIRLGFTIEADYDDDKFKGLDWGGLACEWKNQITARRAM